MRRIVLIGPNRAANSFSLARYERLVSRFSDPREAFISGVVSDRQHGCVAQDSTGHSDFSLPAARRGGKAPPTRATLLVRLRQGADVEAWTAFVDLYMPLVYRFCRRRGLQDADSRDITQQVLSIVHRTIGKFDYDPSRGRFRNWLGAVTSHEIWRHVKQMRRRGHPFRQTTDCEVATLSGAPVDPAWYEEFNGYVFERALARIRHEFEADEWTAFDLTWLRDMKPREAADRLGKPAAWIYKARYKIIERLRVELEYLTSDAAVFHQPS